MPEAPAAPARASIVIAAGAGVMVAIEFVVIGLSPAITGDLGISAARAGWLVTLFAIASATLGPLLVLRCAAMPPARVLSLALLPFAANLLLWPFAFYPLAEALRIAQGATLPLFMSVGATTLTEVLGGRDDRAVARIYMGVTAGGTLGAPAGAAIAGMLGWRPVLGLLGCCALLAALAVGALRGLPRARPAEAQTAILADPRLRSTLLLTGALFAAMFASYSYLGLLLAESGRPALHVAAWLLLFGAAGLAGNAIAARVAGRLLGASALAVATVAGASITLAAQGAPLPLLAGAIVAWGIAHSALFVLCQLSVMRAAPRAPGFAASLNIAAANVGIAIGAFAGGRAIASFGLGGVGIATLLLAAACLAMIRHAARESAFRPAGNRG